MPGSRLQEQGEAGVFERWWQEHSELDQYVTELELALNSSSAARASEALEDLTEALRAHLTVEEDVYFPLLERLLPDQAPGIQEACVAHRDILSDVDQMQDQLSSSDLTGARSTLKTLLRRFRDHEQAEAKMVARLRTPPPV
jgi:hemerythrin-like domain-containing protein